MRLIDEDLIEPPSNCCCDRWVVTNESQGDPHRVVGGQDSPTAKNLAFAPKYFVADRRDDLVGRAADCARLAGNHKIAVGSTAECIKGYALRIVVVNPDCRPSFLAHRRPAFGSKKMREWMHDVSQKKLVDSPKKMLASEGEREVFS